MRTDRVMRKTKLYYKIGYILLRECAGVAYGWSIIVLCSSSGRIKSFNLILHRKK